MYREMKVLLCRWRLKELVNSAASAVKLMILFRIAPSSWLLLPNVVVRDLHLRLN